MDLVYGLALYEFSVAQWIERPPGVWEVIGSIPVGDSNFSLFHARDMLIISSLHLLTELKIYHLSFFDHRNIFLKICHITHAVPSHSLVTPRDVKEKVSREASSAAGSQEWGWDRCIGRLGRNCSHKPYYLPSWPCTSTVHCF